LHRHEEIDEPAFRAWLGATFPTLVTAARELALQIVAKERLVDEVSQEAYFSNRSAAAVWREWQENGGQPPPPPPGREGSDTREAGDSTSKGGPEEEMDEEWKRFFEEEEIDEEDPVAGAFRDMARGLFGAKAKSPTVTSDARATYRRLVQQLHPDRGGEWTPARARLWEHVQEAWNAGDADWLARLEAEWEAGTDLLGPTSAVGRLRAALKEIDAARRDADRKVRVYRKAHAWRFSLQAVPTALHVRMERILRADCEMLREQLADLEMIVTNWERAARRKRVKPRGQRARGQAEFGWGR
jgi:hypothetical protein